MHTAYFDAELTVDLESKSDWEICGVDSELRCRKIGNIVDADFTSDSQDTDYISKNTDFRQGFQHGKTAV